MRRWVETWLARLTERIRELIPETWWCNEENGWWSRKGDNRWGAGTARGLNRDQIVKIARLTGCENFVGKRKKFIFNAFVDLKAVERFENGSDRWGFRSLSTSKRVLKLLLFCILLLANKISDLILPQLWTSPSECCHRSVRKSRMVVLPDGENKWNICLVVSIQYTNVTDRRTDRRTDIAQRHRQCYAAWLQSRDQSDWKWKEKGN